MMRSPCIAAIERSAESGNRIALRYSLDNLKQCLRDAARLPNRPSSGIPARLMTEPSDRALVHSARLGVELKRVTLEMTNDNPGMSPPEH
jgi:hypothetical protein